MNEETPNPQQSNTNDTPPANDTRDVSEIFGKKEEKKTRNAEGTGNFPSYR